MSQETRNVRFVQGNEACVRGALYAGVKFFAGYPITPSTEIAEHLAIQLPKIGGAFIQMEDEIASMCAVCGASLAGRKAMTATSGPGFSLKQEAIGYAAMAEIPCVIVDVQRAGPSTGLATKVGQADVNQARWGTHGEHSIVALTASTIQDMFSITVQAFNIAETYRTPVILLFDEVMGHMRESLTIPEAGELSVVERLKTDVKPGVNYHPYLAREDGRLPMSDYGEEHRFHVTGLFHDIWGFPTEQPQQVDKLVHHLVDKIETRVNELAMWKEFYLDDAEEVLVSYGSCARSARHLVESRRQKGHKIGLLELQTIWPFPKDLVREKTANAKNVYVVELNMGQVLSQVKQAVKDPDRVYLVNRLDGTLVTPTDIGKIMRVIEGKGI
ncbi:2-oxoacid:acceptor oxidoreductase subunit alpha [Pseudodesulfovibrio sp. JC047]|uniref:2-oxoacid:acceptor oxidoreductase subunit alpha n=1 Tax=Pseudodesulfovibrio sp. JC047 TaxID=2683199 RepID=UPI0013D456DC|nr:2-oxoacid:acceptor oxidoreductase subunit alpha [Pseudodesulfovibrio sp. JC047]NDV18380.1 2-oxoacid:acceptor oxidoreductase subunit alpha [Pseudodesulfovibrio sp. JC047]